MPGTLHPSPLFPTQGSLLYLDALHAAFPQALAPRSTALLSWAPARPRAPAGWPLPTLYCSPPEAGALPSRAAALRVQLLFALRARSLRVLEAGLASELHDALATLRSGWPELAQDLALGRLSPQNGLPEDLRGRLQELLVPDAARAAELRAECARGFEGIAQRLWPRLQVVVVGTAHGGERLYLDALRQAECKGLPLYCPFYRAAGGECGPSRAVPVGARVGGLLSCGSAKPSRGGCLAACSIAPRRDLSALQKRPCPALFLEGVRRGKGPGGVTLTCAALCPALLGVNLWPEEPEPRFLLCPNWAFCEFLPCPAEDEEEQRTVLLGELWEGREYRLVLTARPGEYRCCCSAPGGPHALCHPPTSLTLPVPAQVPCRRGAEGVRLQQAVSRGGARAQVRIPQLRIPHRGGGESLCGAGAGGTPGTGHPPVPTPSGRARC